MHRIQWTSLLFLLSGCAALAPRPAAVEVAHRAKGPVAVHFTSRVPERYSILAGPAQSYRRLDVNARLNALLEGYARVKSGPPEGTPIEVFARLESITTGYETIGAVPKVRTRLALGPSRIATDAPLLLARADEVFADSRPYQITKTVEVTVAAEVRREGRDPAKRDLTATVVEVVEREDIDDWAYDYRPLIDEALGEVVGRLDDFVDQVAAGGGR